VDLNGQKRFNSTSENEFKHGNVTYGVPFSIQSVNMMNVPYSLHVKESNSIGVPSMSGQPPPGMMQVMPSASSERSGAQSVNPGNLPLMFGYSPVQLPLLDKDNSWGMISQPQQFHPSYTGRGPPNSGNISQGFPFHCFIPFEGIGLDCMIDGETFVPYFQLLPFPFLQHTEDPNLS
jgi:hypothetical protein